MLFIAIFLLTVVSASKWDIYPSVPKSASINGFADPIYDKLPECARSCVTLTTKMTPCPYWDTGCFCVMPQWSGIVGACFAKQCSGSDVASATSLAYSLCEKVGANIWIMPASVSTQLSVAAGTWQVAAATTKKSDFGDNGIIEPRAEDEQGTETTTTQASTSTGGSEVGSGREASIAASSSSSSGASSIFKTTSIAAFILLAVLSFVR